MIVCHCFGVTESQIKKCKSLKLVRENTNATCGCGGCLSVVKDILKTETEKWFIDAEAGLKTNALAIDPDADLV